MAITLLITYKGQAAREFANEMERRGIAEQIRKEPGNLRYDYYLPLAEEGKVLLVDSWENQAAIDFHHASPMMAEIAHLREKYDLTMTVERYTEEALPPQDQTFIRE